MHPVPRAWVIRTALNLSVSSWRRRRREVSLDHVGSELWPANGGGANGGGANGSGANGVGANGAGPEEAGLDSAILAVLAGLPMRQRQVIALRVFLDLDTAATAAALDIAPGTVTAHLARATSALREQLTHSNLREEPL